MLQNLMSNTTLLTRSVSVYVKVEYIISLHAIFLITISFCIVNMISICIVYFFSKGASFWLKLCKCESVSTTNFTNVKPLK